MGIKSPKGSCDETPRPKPTKEDFYESYTVPVLENPEHTPCPNLLDIICLDGKWAQVSPGPYSIRFLSGENRTIHDIEWDHYRLVRKYSSGVNVGYYREFEPDEITDAEVDNIHWSAEHKEVFFKLMVHVFGEYERKVEDVMQELLEFLGLTRKDLQFIFEGIGKS